jgi:hypothetical protein
MTYAPLAGAVSFFEMNRGHLAFHPGLDGNGGEGLDVADGPKLNGHLLREGRSHGTRNGNLLARVISLRVISGYIPGTAE